MRWLGVLLASAMLAGGGCGDDGRRGGGTGDGGGGGGDGGDEVVDLETYLTENDIQRLELQPDGTEYGVGVTDETGMARFYSEKHQGVLDMSVADRDVEMPLAGREVHLSVGDEELAYMVLDPTEQFAPMLYTMPVPDADGVVDVDAVDVMVEQEDIPDYDPETDGNPFDSASEPIVAGASQQLTIIGVTFTFGIRSFLTGLAAGAVVSVFKNLVEGACNFVAPVYEERCRIIGEVAGFLGSLVGGITVTGVNAWDLGASVLDTGLSIADVNCDKAGKVLVGYVTDPNDRSARDHYREVARKFNYLMHAMETDPQPGQPSWSETQDMAQRLIEVRDVVRNRQFQLWNDTAFESAAPNGFWMKQVSNAAAGFFNAQGANVQAAVLTRLTITEEVQAYLQIGPYDARYVVESHRYVQADWETFEFSVEHSDAAKAMNSLLVGCAFNFVTGAVGEWTDGSTTRAWEAETGAIVEGALQVMEETIDEIYQRHWGDTIPGGTCLADDYEPNATWEQAFASPLPTELGGTSVIELSELNLCDPLGMSGEEDDWYAYYIAPIEFNVQTRIIGVDGGAGQDEPVCLDVYFYSEIYEIGGSPPDRITGVCGRVADWPATSSFGVRRTIGESWSMLLLHVRPDTGATGSDIDYGLRFTP